MCMYVNIDVVYYINVTCCEEQYHLGKMVYET